MRFRLTIYKKLSGAANYSLVLLLWQAGRVKEFAVQSVKAKI